MGERIYQIYGFYSRVKTGKKALLNMKMTSFSILEALLRTRDILTGLRQKFLQM